MFEMRTERLILRDFCYSDVPAYRALRDEKKFQRFYSEEDASEAKAELLVRMFIEQALQNPRTRYQLAVLNKNHELIGSCGVREEAPGEYSIGCEIGRPWHGTGIAREAGRAMVDMGFRKLGAEKIFAETISENSAAVRLCKSLGLSIQEVRTNDRYFKGRAWDTAVLSVHRQEWLKALEQEST